MDAARGRIAVDGLARMLRDGKITRRGFLARAVGLVGSLAAAEGLLAWAVGAQTTGKTDLVIAQGGDISKFDPHLSTTVHDTSVTFNLYDELGNAARFSIDEKFRGQAYREMTKIILEEIPWIPIIQPIESYGLQKYLDWLPYSNQQLETRRFNLKFRRA